MNKTNATITTVTLTVVVAAAALLLTSGCETAKFNEALWDLETNYVNEVVTETNHITITKTNTVTVTQTNMIEVSPDVFLPQVTVTETPTITTTNLTEVNISTNPVAYITSKPDADVVAAAGNIGGLFGVGPLAAALSSLLLGVTGAWRFRGKRANMKEANLRALNESLAQGVETARFILKETPQGIELDSKFKEFLLKNQVAAGVIAEATELAKKKVDSQDAKAIAAEILKLVTGK